MQRPLRAVPVTAVRRCASTAEDRRACPPVTPPVPRHAVRGATRYCRQWAERRDQRQEACAGGLQARTASATRRIVRTHHSMDGRRLVLGVIDDGIEAEWYDEGAAPEPELAPLPRCQVRDRIDLWSTGGSLRC